MPTWFINFRSFYHGAHTHTHTTCSNLVEAFAKLLWPFKLHIILINCKSSLKTQRIWRNRTKQKLVQKRNVKYSAVSFFSAIVIQDKWNRREKWYQQRWLHETNSGRFQHMNQSIRNGMQVLVEWTGREREGDKSDTQCLGHKEG